MHTQSAQIIEQETKNEMNVGLKDTPMGCGLELLDWVSSDRRGDAGSTTTPAASNSGSPRSGATVSCGQPSLSARDVWPGCRSTPYGKCHPTVSSGKGNRRRSGRSRLHRVLFGGATGRYPVALAHASCVQGHYRRQGRDATRQRVRGQRARGDGRRAGIATRGWRPGPTFPLSTSTRSSRRKRAGY